MIDVNKENNMIAEPDENKHRKTGVLLLLVPSDECGQLFREQLVTTGDSRKDQKRLREIMQKVASLL